MSYLQTIQDFWKNRPTTERRVFIGSIVLILFFILGFYWVSLPKNFVPLYNNLSLHEVGQIKDELDAKGISYKLEDGGSTITVPEKESSRLLVELAGENIPESGYIDYSFFGDNASWGMTDNEFNMIKLDAMNNELARLIKQIEGIDEASVMITLPEQSVFVSDQDKTASASIIIHTKRGSQFQKNQIESLYHLVSRAVPNLPKENITIRNQYLEYFDDYASHNSGDQQQYVHQQTVKKDIEQDIQRRLQQMLGAIIGMNQVLVSVTADVDFTKENRIEELVDPVDLENMDGLPVSIETIHETYSGDPGVGGVSGTGEEEPPNYTSPGGSGDGEYELMKETINNEFNHIRREISESPFKIRDLGIQVAVDNVINREGDDIQFLSQQEEYSVEENINSILHSMISSSIDQEYSETNIDEKISVVFQEFTGIEKISPKPSPFTIPLWVYIVGGLLVVLLFILIGLSIRNHRALREDVFEEISETSPEISTAEPTLKTEEESRQTEIERMAREKPEDFAKLLRSWLTED